MYCFIYILYYIYGHYNHHFLSIEHMGIFHSLHTRRESIFMNGIVAYSTFVYDSNWIVNIAEDDFLDTVSCTIGTNVV